MSEVLDADLTSAQIKKLINEDLERSGIEPRAMKKLNLRPLTREEANELAGSKRYGYVIPYFNPNGSEKNFWRVRWLEDKKTFGKAGGYRYHQPPNSTPHVYFPPVVLNWDGVIKNPDITLTITEGEKKAAKACLEGLFCIGIGGVWSFRSKKLNKTFIDDLEQIEWAGRTVNLCFDSDLMYNEQVIAALNSLSHELTQRGAKVFIIYIEDPFKRDGVKLGLDDFLVQYGIEEFNELKREQFKENELLYQMNERLAFVRKKDAVYDMESDIFYNSANKMINMSMANHKFSAVNAAGNMQVRKTAKEWLEWPFRREYRDITYKPGHPEAVDGKYNVWRGWGIDPDLWVPGDISPFMELIDSLIGDDPEFRDWFLKWLACPLQNPGIKMTSAVLLWSPVQGVGKSTLAKIIEAVYGRNFQTIGQKELYSEYNGWAARKQFVVGEEITAINDRRIADSMKALLTDTTIFVNEKYVPQYNVDNCANFLFLSNHPDALRLEKFDRRYAVHRIPCAVPPSRALFKRVYKWKDNGGVAHLCHYLSQELDLGKFDPYGHAISTEAKRILIETGYSDLEAWCNELMSHTDQVLRVDGHLVPGDLFTMSQLRVFMEGDAVKLRDSTNTAFGRALGRFGVVQKLIRLGSDVKVLYAIRNLEKWRTAESTEWRDHYLDTGKTVPSADRKSNNGKLRTGTPRRRTNGNLRIAK